MRQHSSRLALILVAAAAIMGCQALGYEKPKTLEQRIGYADATLTGVNNAATQQLEAHTISSTDAEAVAKVTTSADKALRGAEAALAAGDTATAEGKLAAAVAVLTQLDAWLAKPADQRAELPAPLPESSP